MLIVDANTNINVGEIWITIITILFALSLISESIANLVKLNIKEYRVEPTDEYGKKIKERNVMYLALGSGIFVSFAAGSEFFTLINDAKLISFSKIGDPDLPLGRTILGLLLSGVFISMGSKFWHDILDIVLAFSNLKKYRSRDMEEDVKLKNFEVQRNEQLQLMDQVQSVQHKLSNIPGYVGYQVAISDGGKNKIRMMFNSGKLGAEDQEKLQNYFGKDKIEFETTDVPGTLL